jgi:capsular exopolysaccharide synthesis family protein
MAKVITGVLSNRIDRIITDQSPFALVEAYRNLRTNLFFSVPGKDCCKKIILTSSMATEGKTTTSVNLAITFAQTDNRVLLVDCDLRKPRINKFLKIREKSGLSSYLCGQAKIEDIVLKTKFNNLSVIVAGIIPPNPSELIGGKEMCELVAELEKNFDYIIFDTPPLDVVSDTLILVPLCEGVVIVSKHNVTTHPVLQKSIKKLEFANAKILGLVLNGYNEKKSYKYYKYDYKYKNEYMNKKEK